MKIPLLAAMVLPSAAYAGLLPLGEHVDIRCHYESGAWDVSIYRQATSYAPDEVFLPLSDKPYSGGNPAISGARHTQPASSAFSFTGASPGDPLWIAVQGTPGVGEAWPGFDNDQPAGTFGSYIPNDSRVSQSTARPWIRVSLVDYQPPHGKNSHFSLWNTTTGQPPTVWMSTFDTTVENSYYFAAGSHTHMAWGFTTPGVHRVTLQATAFLGPGATNPTGPSEPFTLIFAVGSIGYWQAEHFDAEQLADPDVSGLDADPDADGVSNLLEYAFGTHPFRGATLPVEAGLGPPVFSIEHVDGSLYETLTYPRRRAGQRLAPDLYQPVFSDRLDGSWNTQGLVVQAGDFPAPHQSLNARWERVVVRRLVPQGASRGYARVGVVAGDGFSTP